MKKPKYYILVGDPQPVTEQDWLTWCAAANRIVASTTLSSTMSLVTSFTGHDRYNMEVPLLWSSVIVGGDRNGEEWFWATHKQAESGHERMVKKLTEDGSP